MKKQKSTALDGLNPKSIRRRQFNLRLNQYYLAALKLLAKPEEGLSMQKIMRSILEKGIDELLKKGIK